MSDGPCEVWFYRLERSGVDQVLPELLERTLARGWRALVRTSDDGRAKSLDERLWAYREDSFLPHGRADEPSPERQPILLTSDEENANGAHALFLLDDAEPGPLDGYARCVLIFDGGDEHALAASRIRWKQVKAAGHPVSYWKQTERGWEKQA